LRKRLTIGGIAMALAATVSFVAAEPRRPPGEAAAPPRSDILTNVRLIGLTPTTRPYRRGPFYVLHAVDLRGTQLRVVADPDLGDIVSVTPLFAPRFDAGPRIIHVPQPGEEADDRDEASPETIERYAPPPRRPLRRPARRSERHLPAPRHNVLSLPPPPGSLSDQVPQFSDKLSAKAEAEKFRAPEEADRLQPAPPDTTAPLKQD
jgi:hypothetical protein